MRFKVKGTLTVDVEIEIEADSHAEAQEELESMDLFVDDSITCTELSITNHADVETRNLCVEEYDKMTKLDRAKILEDNGVTDEAAYEIADREGCEVPPEWLEFFTP